LLKSGVKSIKHDPNGTAIIATQQIDNRGKIQIKKISTPLEQN
tara:strand:+ start:614 stop:742 length:129 start_codon:yes stop_codon:yes gene_type:complete